MPAYADGSLLLQKLCKTRNPTGINLPWGVVFTLLRDQSDDSAICAKDNPKGTSNPSD